MRRLRLNILGINLPISIWTKRDDNGDLVKFEDVEKLIEAYESMRNAADLFGSAVGCPRGETRDCIKGNAWIHKDHAEKLYREVTHHETD